MNSLHTPMQTSNNNQMNHPPRLNSYHQNHGGYNNGTQNGNNQFTDFGNSHNNGSSFNSMSHEMNINSGTMGGGGENVSGSTNNDLPSVNMGGGEYFFYV